MLRIMFAFFLVYIDQIIYSKHTFPSLQRNAFYHESMTVDPWKNLKPISFQQADYVRRSRFPPRQ